MHFTNYLGFNSNSSLIDLEINRIEIIYKKTKWARSGRIQAAARWAGLDQIWRSWGQHLVELTGGVRRSAAGQPEAVRRGANRRIEWRSTAAGHLLPPAMGRQGRNPNRGRQGWRLT
jgi:hypothetical protein